MLLDAIQLRPAWQAEWRLWWALFLRSVDVTSLLADHGFAPRSAFLSELGHRLRKLLPRHPRPPTWPSCSNCWRPAASTPSGCVPSMARPQRLQQQLFSALAHARETPDAQGAAWSRAEGQTVLLDALTYSVGQISATGFASEIRQRMSEQAQHEPLSRAARALRGPAPGRAATRPAQPRRAAGRRGAAPAAGCLPPRRPDRLHPPRRARHLGGHRVPAAPAARAWCASAPCWTACSPTPAAVARLLARLVLASEEGAACAR
jgi:hypothetical protein